MSVNKGRLKYLLSKHPSPLDKVRNHNNVKVPLAKTLSETKSIVEDNQVKEGLRFTLWNDLLNTYGVFGDKKDELNTPLSKDRYVKGQKVFIDLGYNIGREASMAHPAIILKNFKDLVVVVPTTTDDGANMGELEKMLIHCPKDNDIFPGDDIIELHQIRTIGKNRILKNFGKNVKDYTLPSEEVDTLNQIIRDRTITWGYRDGIIPYGTDLRSIIELMIMFHYSPSVFETLVLKHLEVQKLQVQNHKLKAEIELSIPSKQVAPHVED